MEIMKHFEVLIGREDVQNPKPHPEPVIKALFELKAQKEDAWMIGDTKMDLQSAKSAGINSIGVTCGYGSENELRSFTKNVYKNSYDAIKSIE